MREKTKAKPNHDFAADVKQLIPQPQLANIAAIILAFSDLETTLDQFVMTVKDLHGDPGWEFCAAQNRDVKNAIIKTGVIGILSDNECEELSTILGDDWFGKLRTARNCLAHLRHLDVVTGTGLMKVERTGDFYKVLATVDVLDAAYNQLLTLHREIYWTIRLVAMLKNVGRAGSGVPDKAFRDQWISDCRTKIKDFWSFRISLPAIPEFPPEADWRSAEADYRRAEMESTMRALRQ